MRVFRLIVPALVLLLLPACRQQQVPVIPEVTDVPETPDLVEYTLHASAPGTRTVLDGTNDKKILWSDEESISVLYDGVNYKFDGTPSNDRTEASFTGMAPAGMESYIALYPYDNLARMEGDYVNCTLTANQMGREGSFADGYLFMADDVTGNVISFNHLCSGLRFRFNRDNITSVSIQGSDEENIAGGFQFRFTAADTPEVRNALEDIVTLTSPSGNFIRGHGYYIIILPTVFSKGFTISADNGKETGILHFDSEVTFSRGTFKDISGNLDERMMWTQAYYGPENSYCLRPNESTSFDVSPKKITGRWRRSNESADGADVPDGVQTLWGNATASLNGTTLTVGSASAGSSLVAIKKGEKILWSYLIWVTDEAPTETTLPSGAKILPALGENCYFQWGRKDPLRPDSSVLAYPGDGNSLSASIQNPSSYIRSGTGQIDWYANSSAKQDATLWGGERGSKTVWDPCPSGWRVPPESVFDNLTYQEPKITQDSWSFAKLGYLTSNGNNLTVSDSGWDARCWTHTPTGNQASSLLMETDSNGFKGFSLQGNYRHMGLSVRCVKD